MNGTQNKPQDRSWMASSFLMLMTSLLMGVLGSPPAVADVSKEMEKGHPEVADQLSFFKQTALEMRQTAYTLDAMTPSRQLDWRSHTHNLETLREQVNQLGRTLTDLEQLKPEASEGQRIAIESARPPLVAAAQQLREAINLIADDRQSVYWLPYSETVSTLSGHAESLYETVDTLMDYEKVRVRHLSLDLAPSGQGG